MRHAGTPFDAPMRLLRDGQPFGILVDYGYETPWATARLVEIADEVEMQRLVAYHNFLTWLESDSLADDLSIDESDEQYERELAAHGLSKETFDRCKGARWLVVTVGGQEHPLYAPDFDDDNVVQWRW